MFNGLTVLASGDQIRESDMATILTHPLKRIRTRTAEIIGFVLSESRRTLRVLHCRGYIKDLDDGSFNFAGKRKWEVVEIERHSAPRTAVQSLFTNKEFERLYANTGNH